MAAAAPATYIYPTAAPLETVAGPHSKGATGRIFLLLPAAPVGNNTSPEEACTGAVGRYCCTSHTMCRYGTVPRATSRF